MASVNRVILVGNLGKDPELRYMPDGAAVTGVSIATTESWKGKSGEKQEKTEWHRVSFFGRLAETANQYLRKGSQVYIEGRIQTRKWQDKEGQDRYTTEIVADRMQMLSGRAGQDAPSAEEPARPEPNPVRSRGPAPAQSGGGFDDDIPFAAVRGAMLNAV